MVPITVDGQLTCAQEVAQGIVNAEGTVDSCSVTHGGVSVRMVDPLHYPKWNDLVCSFPNHSIFHSANWASVLHRSYGYTPRYFAMFAGEKLCALIPLMEVSSIITGKRGVSLPFSDYCEPLAAGGISSLKAFTSMVEYAKSAGWKYIEFRGQGCVSEDASCFSQYYRHVLPLSSNPNMIASCFRDSTTRNIHKAVREGVAVNFYDTMSAVEEFYRLNGITRKYHGLPAQPILFFRNIFESIVSQGLGKVALATYRGETIAGAMFFHMGEQALYKFGASDRRFQKLRANNLVIWEAIKWYADRGIRSLCLGRTDCENVGLRQFKKGWGGQEQVIKYYRYNPSKEQFFGVCRTSTRQTYRIFQAIPLRLSGMVGEILYRHMG